MALGPTPYWGRMDRAALLACSSHRVIGLAEVQEDLIEWPLAAGGKLLDKLGFNDGCAGAPAGPKAVQGVVEFYG